MSKGIDILLVEDNPGDVRLTVEAFRKSKLACRVTVARDGEEALACIDQRIDLARRHHNNRMEADGWEQKARAFEQMEKSDEALRCLKRSIEISQRPPPYESLHRYLEEVSTRPPFRR